MGKTRTVRHKYQKSCTVWFPLSRDAPHKPIIDETHVTLGRLRQNVWGVPQGHPLRRFPDTKKAKVESCPGVRQKPSLDPPFELFLVPAAPGALFDQIQAHILGSLCLQRPRRFRFKRESTAHSTKTLLTYWLFSRNAHGSCKPSTYIGPQAQQKYRTVRHGRESPVLFGLGAEGHVMLTLKPGSHA